MFEGATVGAAARVLGAVVLLEVFAVGAAAAERRPVLTLTPAQEKSESATVFDCDHEGELGCLIAACKSPKLSADDAADVQYLYREVWQDFPQNLAPRLRACFLRAGGRFR